MCGSYDFKVVYYPCDVNYSDGMQCVSTVISYPKIAKCAAKIFAKTNGVIKAQLCA